MKNKHIPLFQDQEPVRKINKFVLILLGVTFLCSALVVIFALQFEQIFPRYDFQEFRLLEQAPYELLPQRDILWVDEEKTAPKRSAIDKESPMIFRYDDEKTRLIIEKYRTLEEYINAKKNNTIEPKKELLYKNLGLNTIIDDKLSSAILEMNPEELDEIFAMTELLLLEAVNNGVFSFSGVARDLFNIQRVEIARETAGRTH